MKYNHKILDYFHKYKTFFFSLIFITIPPFIQFLILSHVYGNMNLIKIQIWRRGQCEK